MTKIGIDNEVVELKGKEETDFLAQKQKDQAFFDEYENNLNFKAKSKQDLCDKLGITIDEANLLLS
jgi:hypothetical protein